MSAARLLRAPAATLLALALASSPSPRAAPVPAAGGLPGEDREMAGGWRGVGTDLAAMSRRVRHPGRRGRRFAAVVLGTAGALYLARHEIRAAVQRNRTDEISDVLQAARNQGKGAVAPILALGLATAGWSRGNDQRLVQARRLLTGCGAALLVAGTGQVVLATERPEDGDDVRFFAANGHGVSADASLAGCPVYPLSRWLLGPRAGESRARRFWRRAGRGLLFAAAGLTALQRLDQDKHWAPDAFLGLMNGLTMGRWVTELEEEGGLARTGLAPASRRLRWGWTGGGITLRLRLGRARDVDRVAAAR